MKRTLLMGIAVMSIALGSITSAQDPRAQRSQQLAALLKDVQAQQVTIARNQAAMDAKLSALAEALRLARIYSSRGG